MYKPKAETIAGLGFRRFSVSMQVYISLSFFLILRSRWSLSKVHWTFFTFVAQFGVVHCI